MKTVMAYFGNHAEAIRVSPVIAKLTESPHLTVSVVSPQNQLDNAYSVAKLFAIKPDLTFPKPRKSRHGAPRFSHLLAEAGRLLAAAAPDALLIHISDQKSAALASAANHLDIPLISLDTADAEFALKTSGPHPLTGQKRADLFLEATRSGYDRLLADGVAAHSVQLTGSTTIDSLLHGISAAQAGRRSASNPLVLRQFLTGSKAPILAIARGPKDDAAVTALVMAMLDSAAAHPDRNYVVSSSAAMTDFRWRRAAATRPNLLLCGSLEFSDYCRLLARSKVVLTDDATVQREATVLGKTVLLPGQTRQAPAGEARSIGSDPIRISTEIDLAFRWRSPGVHSGDPFGDGLAAVRSATAVTELLGITGTSCQRPKQAPIGKASQHPARTRTMEAS